jgi:uncharacterized protein DUF3300
MKSIQHLRTEARTVGTLATTPQQQVITQGESIAIVPAEPQVIYVPQYDPEVVYVSPEVSQPVSQESGVSTGAAVASGVLAFGAGLAIGAWLNRDVHWQDEGIYYHGWSGGGWVGASSSYVDVNRSVYVNNSYRNVNVNRTVVNRDINNYRTDLDRRAAVRSDAINRRNPNAGPTDRLEGRQGRDDVGRAKQGDRGRDRTPASASASGKLGGAERNRGKEGARVADRSGREVAATASGRDNSGGGGGKSARSGGGGGGKGARGGGGGKSAHSGGGGGGKGARGGGGGKSAQAGGGGGGKGGGGGRKR